MGNKTKIWVMFPTSGLDHRGAWDAEDMQQKVMSNGEMLDQIAQVCEDVEFIGPVNLVDEERLDQVSRSHYGTTAEERTFQAETHSIARERAEESRSIWPRDRPLAPVRVVSGYREGG